MTTTRFTRTGQTEYTPDGQIDRFTLELRPGHTVTRTDVTNTMYAGHRGRATSVDLDRELVCTCGGSVRGGYAVREDMERLRHFDSTAEREESERQDAIVRERILRSL